MRGSGLSGSCTKAGSLTEQFGAWRIEETRLLVHAMWRRTLDKPMVGSGTSSRSRTSFCIVLPVTCLLSLRSLYPRVCSFRVHELRTICQHRKVWLREGQSLDSLDGRAKREQMPNNRNATRG